MTASHYKHEDGNYCCPNLAYLSFHSNLSLFPDPVPYTGKPRVTEEDC